LWQENLQPGIAFSRRDASVAYPQSKSALIGAGRNAAHVRDSGAKPRAGLSPLAAVPTPQGEKWLAK